MEHRRIVAAIRDGDPRRAESEVRRHIAAAKADVLAWLATGAVRPAAGR